MSLLCSVDVSYRCVCLLDLGQGWATHTHLHTQSKEAKRTGWSLRFTCMYAKFGNATPSCRVVQRCGWVYLCLIAFLFLWFTALFSLTSLPLFQSLARLNTAAFSVLLSRGGAKFECCVYRESKTNPAQYDFKMSQILFRCRAARSILIHNPFMPRCLSLLIMRQVPLGNYFCRSVSFMLQMVSLPGNTHTEWQG